MMFSSSRAVIYGVGWDEKFCAQPALGRQEQGSGMGNGTGGAKTDYSHFDKGRRERPPQAGMAPSTQGSIFSSNA